MPTVRAQLLETAEWWVLVATVTLTPLVFSRWTFDVFNITELTALWIGVVLALALQLIRLPSRDRLPAPTIWPYVAAYLGVFILTTFTSRAPMVSLLGNYGRLGGLLTVMPAALLGWLLFIRIAQGRDRSRQLLTAIALSSLIGAVYLIAQELNIENHAWLQFGGQNPTHPPGLLGNSNFSGGHIAMGVGPMVWLAVQSHRRSRFGWIVAVLVSLAGVGISQSRGAMLATALALVLTATRLRLPSRRLIAAAAAAIVVLGTVTLITSNRGVADLVNSNTTDQRIDLWEVALQSSPDHLLLGGGPDLYLLTFRDNAGPVLEGVVADEPHNVLLDHLDGSGLLGAGTWLALVVAVGLAARGGNRRDVGPWSVMGATYLAQSMVSIDAVPLQTWAWVAVAGIVSSARAAPHEAVDRQATVRPVGVVTLVAGLALAGVGILIAIQPFRADMSYRRAIIASNAGDPHTAISQFEEATERHRWEPRYHSRLGLELWGTADFSDPEAVDATRGALLDALRLFPDDPSANAWLTGVDEQIAALNG